MQRLFLEFKHLEMIRAIALSGRVSDAAETLGLTPSALSHRIREAERRLGVELYARSHKKLKPLPSADYLAQVAERVLGEMTRAEEDVQRMTSGVSHVVRIAVEAYSSYHWLPAFIRVVRAQLPGVDLQVTAGARSDPVRALMNHQVDLAIVSSEATAIGVTAIPLFEDELLYIVPPDHRLAAQPSVEAQDIAGEDFITYTRVPQPGQEYDRLFRPAKAYPRWTTTIELPEAIIEMVAAGLGTSILANWALQSALRDKRVAAARLGAEGLPLTWRLVWRREEDGQGSGPVTEVADLLAGWCALPDGGLDRL